ncbi:MAG: phosphatase PAP2 family protein [Thermoleophilia bacterium]
MAELRETDAVAPDAPAAPGRLARAARAVDAAVHRPFRKRPWTFEVALFAFALLVYQGSRALVVGEPSTAFRNAAEIVRWEKGSGLFVETSIQQWVLNHIRLVEVLNYFYMYGHWTITPLFFIWLYRRRARLYPYVRNAFLAANGIALVCFMVFPVAPPRLLSSQGFVDTLNNISDIDLHGGVLAGWFNPHAAVPSMHFGYALMIGMVGLVLLRSWPLRLLALAYPAVVFLTITGTGNHFVLDALAGGLVVAVSFIVVWAWMATHGGLPRPVPARIPAERR